MAGDSGSPGRPPRLTTAGRRLMPMADLPRVGRKGAYNPPAVSKSSMELDLEFMRQVADGSRAAFLALYDRHASRVYGLTLRILGDHGSAEEATQDTFFKVWSRARSFNPARGSLLAWLLTIARRTALDRVRLEGRRPTAAELPDGEGPLPELLDPASLTDEARWRSLRFALGDLPPEQRRPIELAFFHGISHREIALELEQPLGTVKTRLRLGMERLRRNWLGELSGSDQARRGVDQNVEARSDE